MGEAAIRIEALRKEYRTPGRPPTVALEALDLEVRRGEIFGLLGPNGAGKTTTVGILTTRVRPTSGRAAVLGADVAADAVAVKRRIGVVPQRPNPDRALAASENLVFHARYFGIGRLEAQARATRLLDELGLSEKASAKVQQLSGGQQQRLMIARALIHEPEVFFLDEPTVGLDPQSRLAIWELLRKLPAQGRTVVLTTHDMDEADRLCDRVAIVDRGKLLANGSPPDLKALAPGGTLVELILDGAAAPALPSAQQVRGVLRVSAEGAALRAYVERPGESMGGLLRAAESAGRAVRDVHLSPPSLETLFLDLTGRRLS
jgi:ABC-2 type transport system ATP-binding protein